MMTYPTSEIATLFSPQIRIRWAEYWFIANRARLKLKTWLQNVSARAFRSPLTRSSCTVFAVRLGAFGVPVYDVLPLPSQIYHGNRLQMHAHNKTLLSSHIFYDDGPKIAFMRTRKTSRTTRRSFAWKGRVRGREREREILETHTLHYTWYCVTRTK